MVLDELVVRGEAGPWLYAREKKVVRRANCALGAASKVVGGRGRSDEVVTVFSRPVQVQVAPGKRRKEGGSREKDREWGRKKKRKRKEKERKKKKKFISGCLGFESIRINFAFEFSYRNISRAKFACIFNINKYGSNVNSPLKQKCKIIL